ncbi:MAG: potassium transporter TrkG [Clostridia bacterium]|nr:potassium transporter TrkG [Clostridia bacterium]
MLDNNNKYKKTLRRKYKMPAPMIIILGFFAAILLGSLLLSLPFATSERLSYSDLLFTATSAVCVVGLTVVDIAQSYTLFGQIVILLLIQIGGLGIMTAATLVFIFLGKKITLKERLTLSESYNQQSLQGVVRLTLIIVVYTLVIELSGAVLLSFDFINRYGFSRGFYYAIFHSVSAFCNAGISLVDFSTSAYSSNILINLSLMSLIFLGGLGFSVINEMFTKRKGRYSFQTRVVILTSITLILSSSLLFMITEWSNPDTLGKYSFFDKLLHSLFQSTTARTAGYSTINQSKITDAGIIITIINMFIGASPASTGGGIKTTTAFLLIILLINGLKGGGKELNVFGYSISSKTASKAVTFFIYSLIMIIVSTFVILIIESGNTNITLKSVVFETVSAFSTVGLSLGITAEFSALSRILIMILMFVGRLGFLMIAIMFINRKQKENVTIKYPEVSVMIG